MRNLIFFFSFLFAGCASNFSIDSEIVTTAVHSDTKVFFLGTETIQDTKGFSNVPLYRSHERVSEEDSDYLVAHGDPVTILVNKVILPEALFDHKVGSKSSSYDIAVVLDIAAKEGNDKESIAVFYQRGVKPNTALSFENLSVYSQDTWDNRLPPYFRIRIFNVSNEKNERTKELLEQVDQASATLSSIASAPYFEPILNVATKAAELVTKGENQMLVDFQFQLFSAAHTSQSGGMPVGVFRKGGLVVVGNPRGESRQYWAGKDFFYDFSSEEIKYGDGSSVVDAPFLLATVITTDTVIPNVVKKRSAEIFEILRNDAALKSDFELALNSVTRLETALKSMRSKEKFASNPNVSTLETLITEGVSATVGEEPNQITQGMYNWLLATVRTATGVRRDDFEGYSTWIKACSSIIPFESNLRKFNPEGVTLPEECK